MWSIWDESRIKVMNEPWMRRLKKVAWEVFKGKVSMILPLIIVCWQMLNNEMFKR